ncbi:MAG: hypothetical protein U1F76_05405 [Candidatus Competibacteraceae bacterium]
MDKVQESQDNALQQELNSLPSGTTLELTPPRGEFPGPLVIRENITIEGKGATFWALKGPVVTVRGKGVVLRNLRIEVTGNEMATDTADEYAILLEPGAGLTLENVEVRGAVKGWPAEEGDWDIPRTLSLGRLAHGHTHELVLRVHVPVPCKITSEIAGLTIEPPNLKPGLNQLRLQIEQLSKDTLLDGSLVLTTAFLKRRIAVNAYIAPGHDQTGLQAVIGQGQVIWEPGNWQELLIRPSPAPPGVTPTTAPSTEPLSPEPPSPVISLPIAAPVNPPISSPSGQPRVSMPSTLAREQTPGGLFKQPIPQRVTSPGEQSLSDVPILSDLFDSSGKKKSVEPTDQGADKIQASVSSAGGVSDLFLAGGAKKPESKKVQVSPPLAVTESSPFAPLSQHSNSSQPIPVDSIFTVKKAETSDTVAIEQSQKEATSGESVESSTLNQPAESQDRKRHKKIFSTADIPTLFKRSKD